MAGDEEPNSKRKVHQLNPKRRAKLKRKAEEEPVSEEEKKRRAEQKRRRLLAFKLRSEGRSYNPTTFKKMKKRQERGGRAVGRDGGRRRAKVKIKSSQRNKAPYNVIILPIVWHQRKQEAARIMAAAESAQQLLQSAGISCRIDDADKFTPGQRMKYWELRGVRVRLEIGPKESLAGSAVLAVAAGQPGEVASKSSVKVKEHVLSDRVRAALQQLGQELLAPEQAEQQQQQQEEEEEEEDQDGGNIEGEEELSAEEDLEQFQQQHKQQQQQQEGKQKRKRKPAEDEQPVAAAAADAGPKKRKKHTTDGAAAAAAAAVNGAAPGSSAGKPKKQQQQKRQPQESKEQLKQKLKALVDDAEKASSIADTVLQGTEAVAAGQPQQQQVPSQQQQKQQQQKQQQQHAFASGDALEDDFDFGAATEEAEAAGSKKGKQKKKAKHKGAAGDDAGLLPLAGWGEGEAGARKPKKSKVVKF